MAARAVTPSVPSIPPTRWASWKQVLFREPLSRAQSIVGTVAGLLSIAGALVSSPFAVPGNTGELVATVQEASSHRGVTDATIEVLTTQDDLVATLTPDRSGRATRDLREGVYVVRVSHPRYAAEARRIRVLSRHTVEVRANLRPGSSSPVQRAVNDGVRAVRRALRF